MNKAQKILIASRHMMKPIEYQYDGKNWWEFKDMITTLGEIAKIDGARYVENQKLQSFIDDVEEKLGEIKVYQILDLHFDSDERCDSYCMWIGETPFSIWNKVGDHSCYDDGYEFFDMELFNKLKTMMHIHFSEEQEHYSFNDGEKMESILDLISPVNNYLSTKIEKERLWYKIESPSWCCSLSQNLSRASLIQHNGKEIVKFDKLKGTIGSYASQESEYPRVDIWYSDSVEPINVLVSELWLSD